MASAFGGQRSIQLSYGCLARGLLARGMTGFLADAGRLRNGKARRSRRVVHIHLRFGPVAHAGA